KFISRYRAYHGNSFGSLAATGQAKRKISYEPLAPGFLHVTPPDLYRTPYQGTEEEQALACADEIDRVIGWEINETIAAVIMERSEEHTSELQSRFGLVCRLLLEKKNIRIHTLCDRSKLFILI